MKPKKIFDYVLDIGTIKNINFDETIKYTASMFDHWGKEFGCSAFVKTLEDGSTIVARNLDLDISNKPAFVFKTDCEGYHKTIGLMYYCAVTDDYKDVLKNGIDDDFVSFVPFVSCDLMNEHGLYVETNMRTDEYYEDGSPKFASSGTNPNAKQRVFLGSLPALITHNCKNVDEALEYVKSIDIYSIQGGSVSWPLSFILADADGRYGVLEIVNNEIIFNDMQPAQTNFYINEKYRSIEDFKAGYGENSRYDTIMKNIDSCKTKDDMFELIKKVSYFQIYKPLESQNIDSRSEFVHEFPHWTTDYLYDPANEEEVTREINKIIDKVSKRSRQVLQDLCCDWESIFSLIADTKEKTIMVRFFEDDERIYTHTF